MTPALTISLRPFGASLLPIVSISHVCPKCDHALEPVETADGRVVGEECPECGYRESQGRMA